MCITRALHGVVPAKDDTGRDTAGAVTPENTSSDEGVAEAHRQSTPKDEGVERDHFEPMTFDEGVTSKPRGTEEGADKKRTLADTDDPMPALTRDGQKQRPLAPRPSPLPVVHEAGPPLHVVGAESRAGCDGGGETQADASAWENNANSTKAHPITALDLFSGCGGIAHALRQLGLEIIGLCHCSLLACSLQFQVSDNFLLVPPVVS